MKVTIFVMSLIGLIGLIGLMGVFAQSPGVEVTNTYQIADKAAVDGDIMVSGKDGFVRAGLAADSAMFGVLSQNPVIVFRSGEAGALPIVRSGVARVNVTDGNGKIEKGDYVTSSTTPGKGQKATSSGYAVGIALEPLNSKEGQILVAVKIEYAEISNARTMARVLDMLGASFFTNLKDPGKLPMFMRYFSAGLVLLASVAFAFLTFSRSVPKSIEAIGRNPLARGTIIFSLGMSIFFTITTIGLGLLAAVIILRV